MDRLIVKIKEVDDKGDQFIIDIVNELSLIKNNYDNGQLTGNQFQDLAFELINLQKVRRMVISVERKVRLLQALTQIKNILEDEFK